MIDPRPYTYQYRKPRLNNPTYQSSNLYESLYHLRLPQKSDYFIQRQIKPQQSQAFKLPKKQQYSQQIRNPSPQNPQKYMQNHQFQRYNSYRKDMNQLNDNSSLRHSLDVKQRQRGRYQEKPNSSNNNVKKIGQNINIEMRNQSSSLEKPRQDSRGLQSHLSNYGDNLMKGSQFDRFSIFQKQQKGYNIINCYPTQMQRSLRAFPKLTLENKLIQKGAYSRRD